MNTLLKRVLYFYISSILVFNINAFATNISALDKKLFADSDIDIVKRHLLHNIISKKIDMVENIMGKSIHSMPGAVLASPIDKDDSFIMDYQYHWVRDAAITMGQVAELYIQN